MGMKVYMKELGGASWTDVTSRTVRTDFKLREGFSSLGKGLDLGKLSITYKASDLAVASVFHTTAKQVRIMRDDEVVFEGYTEGSASVKPSRSSADAWVNVTAYPYLYALRSSRLDHDIVVYDVRVSDLNDETHSIMHILWNAMLDSIDPRIKAEIERNYNVEFPNLRDRRGIFFLEADSQPYSEFSKLIGEFTLSMWLDGSTVRFSKPYANDDRQIVELNYTDVIENPTIKTSPYIVAKRPVVSVGKIMESSDETIFSLGEAENDSFSGVDIEVGQSYPDEDVADISYSSSRENDTRSFYYARNPRFSYEAFSSVDGVQTRAVLREDVMELQGTSARIKLTNDTGRFVFMRDARIVAETAYFLDTSTTAVADCDGEDDQISTSYISTEAEVKAYIEALVMERKAETSTLKFSSGKVTAIRPNSLVAIGEVPAVHLVRSVERNLVTGVVSYDCIMFDLDNIDAEYFYKTGGQQAKRGLSAYQVAVNNGFVGTVDEWLQSLNGKGLEIQYCYGDSILTPPYDGEWLPREEFAWKYADYLGFIDGLEIVLNEANVVFPGVLNGQYLWARTKAGEADTWVYYRMTGEEGEDAKLVEISATPLTYTSNKRSLDIDLIECEAQVSGYTEVSYSWLAYPKGSPGNVLASGNGPLFSFNASHQLTVDIIVSMVATCDGEQIPKEIKITPNVVQTIAKFLGCLDEIPETAGSEPLVEGDYFVARSRIQTTLNNVAVDIKTGECWEFRPGLAQRWTMVGVNGAEKHLNALNGLLRSDANLADLSSNSSVAWFNLIIANRIVGNSIFGNDIEVGRDIRGGGYDEAGNKTGDIGFWLGANGKAKVTDGDFDKATIKDADIEDAHLQDVSINGNLGNKAFCAHTLPEFSLVLQTARSVVVGGSTVSRYCIPYDDVADKISVDGSSYYGTTEKDLQEETGAYINVNGTTYNAHSYVPIVAKRRTEANGKIVIDFYANGSSSANTIYTLVATIETDDSKAWFTCSKTVRFYSGAESRTAGVVNLLPMNLVESSESQKYIEYTDGAKYVMGKGHLGTQWLPFYMMVANFIYGAESSVHTSRASIFSGEVGGDTARFNGNVNVPGTTNTVYGAVFN